MTRHRLLLVGIPETHVERAIPRAKALGCEVIIGAPADRMAAFERQVAGADRLVELPHGDERALSQLAERLHRSRPLTGIFTFKEDALMAVARLQEAYGMRANRPAVVGSCLDKIQTRRRLERHGLPGPRYACCRTVEEARRFARHLGRPVILKPPDRQGSLGVTAAASEWEVEPAFEAAQRHSASGRVLAEEQLTGPEISIEAMMFRGRPFVFGVTDKLLFPKTFVESGHLSPSTYEHSTEQWSSMVGRIVGALGIRYGPLHIEGFQTNRGFIVGEVHTRYGGDHITTITELGHSCDMHSPVFAELLGLQYHLQLRPPVRSAGVRFISAPEGTVRAIRGLGEARGDRAVVRIDMQCKLGDAVPPLKSSFDRKGGWVISAGPRRSDVSDALARAVRTIRIETTSEGETDGGQGEPFTYDARRH